MSASQAGFADELQISPRAVVAVLALAGLAFVVFGDRQSLSYGGLLVMFYGVAIHALVLTAWRSAVPAPRLSRWLLVLAAFGVVYGGATWLGGAGLLSLLPAVTALAAVAIDLRAATGVACAGTLFSLALLAGPGGQRPDPIPGLLIGVTLANWSLLGLLALQRTPLDRLTGWLWDYFERTRNALEDARDRKAELEQALSDLAHANRQLVLANERLAALRLVAEEAQKNKAAFVARVSHEFRTPLNMIIGLVDLLTQTPEVYGEELPGKLLDDLSIVQRNCQHLASMINDVLDLSQVEAGRLGLQREWVDLAEIVDGARAVVQPLLDKKQLYWRLVADPDLPQVYCDRTRIRQVILNLASNAARFTDQGGITVTISRQGQSIVTGVADTGAGMLPEDAARVFEPFAPGTSPAWRERTGSGLGLSISKNFIQLHDGRIWLETTHGRGTTFSFSLPVSPPALQLAQPGGWIREDWPWFERPLRADRPRSQELPARPRLVICDETGALYPALVRHGDEVELVDTHDLGQVRRELAACPAHALLINVGSPAALRQAVEDACREAPDTPVVGCSVLPLTQYASVAGAADYLVKPVTRASLQQAIGKVQAQRQGPRPLPLRRLLLVDDDPDVLQLWMRLVHAYDPLLEITMASSGTEALDRLRGGQFDLMLLDIVLPDMDGWQVLALKREEASCRDVPVIVVSAQDPAEQPLSARFLLTSFGQGLSMGKLLRCSLALSALLLRPD